MGINNSQCHVYVAVLRGIYQDLVGAIGLQSEIERDVLEIEQRVRTEGVAFLTKTLPGLGKSIDLSLASGCNLHVVGFKKKRGTALPAFGWCMLRLLFDDEGIPFFAKERVCASDSDIVGESPTEAAPISSNGGYSSRETMVMALKALRQICYLFYKLDIPYHEDQNKKVIDDFIETDKHLPRIRASTGDSTTQAITKQARRLISRVLCNSCPLSGMPKHGPGSVSTGEDPGEKHLFKRLYKRLERVYKVDNWFYLNSSHLAESFEHLQSLASHRAGLAKVVLVPKDSRGPRLISCEPLELQWIQQSQMSVLVDAIENHRLTKGHVNFTDQSINQRLAIAGSTGEYPWATLDMKEASDRVSLGLVHSLFPPRWFEALYASRSSHTQLPSGAKVRLKKFAPMGSAVCFPVEALIFWSLSVSALMICKNKSLKEATASVFVYGDDIICNAADHGVIIEHLEKYGLMVNLNKCCTAGPFKESCGMDAFLGISVTPLKLRKAWSSLPKPSIMISWVAFSNAAWADRMFETATIVEGLLNKLFPGQIPSVSLRNPSVACFVRPEVIKSTHRSPGVKYRKNMRLHRLEARGWTLRPTSTMTKTTGYPLLLRLLADLERRNETSLLSDVSSSTLQTGHFAMAHREKPTRAWTAV